MANECQPMRIVKLKPGTSNYKAKIVLEVSAVYEMEIRTVARSPEDADAQAENLMLSEMDKLTDQFIETQLPKTIGGMSLDAESVKGDFVNEWPEKIR